MISLESTLKETLDELARGGVDRRHPFRFLNFSTVNQSVPDSRMVVMRKFQRTPVGCTIYTDSRSRKIEHLTESQQQACLLFWNPKKRCQVKAIARCDFISGKQAQELYAGLPEAGQAAYNSFYPPSTDVSSFEESYRQREICDNQYFMLIQCYIHQLEALYLQDKYHRRALFTFDDKGALLDSSWLVA